MSRIVRAALSMLVFLAPQAHATVFCVATTQDLANALNAASNSSNSDEVRIQAGLYTATSGLAFFSNPNFTKTFTISGGWINFLGQCDLQFPIAGLTVIDGNNTGPGLVFQLQGAAPGPLFVSNLTVRNTKSVGNASGLSVSISQSNAPDVRIANVQVLNAQGTTNSGLGVVGRADVLIRNVLVADGAATLTSGLFVNQNDTGPVVLNHVTVANNYGDTIVGGLVLQTTVASTVSNAILVGNHGPTVGDCDIISTYSNTKVVNAIIDKVCYTLDPASTGILDVDPKFVAADDYRLRSDSPARDAGIASPVGGLVSLDLDGTARTLGPKPDLGAFESVALFSNGFEQAP